MTDRAETDQKRSALLRQAEEQDAIVADDLAVAEAYERQAKARREHCSHSVAEAARLRAEVARIDAEQAKPRTFVSTGYEQSDIWVSANCPGFQQRLYLRETTPEPAPVPPASVSEAAVEAYKRGYRGHVEANFDFGGTRDREYNHNIFAGLSAAFPLLYRDRLVTVWEGAEAHPLNPQLRKIGRYWLTKYEFLRPHGAEGV